jgi:hypothetical protein
MSHGTLSAHDVPAYRPGAQPGLLRGAWPSVLERAGHRPEGELEATNYFFSIGDQDGSLLELISYD